MTNKQTIIRINTYCKKKKKVRISENFQDFAI